MGRATIEPMSGGFSEGVGSNDHGYSFVSFLVATRPPAGMFEEWRSLRSSFLSESANVMIRSPLGGDLSEGQLTTPEGEAVVGHGNQSDEDVVR